MYVKPTEGRTVPDPARGDTLPPQGRTVEASQYWQRRLADGDVVEAEPEPEPEEETPADAAVQTSAPAKPAPARNKKKES
ncbi:MAG TPA: DUF2635 domain-containing protein [Azonexus sp.]|nr:DUF2635 domain-containing protein [Azonexus sp.]